MFSFQNVDYFIKDRKLLNNVSFQVNNGQHIALVGRNGSGKSTIFNLIQRKLEPDRGDIKTSKSYDILAIEQEMPSANLTPMEHLLMKDKERHELLQELESCEDYDRIADLYDRLIEIDAYSAESRASKILKGLGFDDDAQNKKMSNFSGGFRMRVALAAAIYQEPDLLLLDEPTNHLDFETTQWLQNFLKKYPKSFILISHDKDFLNHSADFIIHLKNANATIYNGNYDIFVKTYNLQQSNIKSHNEKLSAQKSRMLDFVNRFKAKASKAKQAQSRIKAIEKMEFLELDEDETFIKLDFLDSQKVSPPILKYEKIYLGYDDKLVLKNISGMLYPYDKIGLIGPNGNGKTTFANFLAGQLSQQKGDLTRANNLKIGYYKQDYLDSFDPNTTIYGQLKEYIKTNNDFEIRKHLGRFGFSGFGVDQKIKELSGGEKARLLFACLTFDNPNLLILDEPTNHLDIEMRESLVRSLNEYNGAIILITHDKFLLEHVADSLWLVQNNTIKDFNYDINQYKKELLTRAS